MSPQYRLSRNGTYCDSDDHGLAESKRQSDTTCREPLTLLWGDLRSLGTKRIAVRVFNRGQSLQSSLDLGAPVAWYTVL